jgi:hypothetical protein
MWEYKFGENGARPGCKSIPNKIVRSSPWFIKIIPSLPSSSTSKRVLESGSKSLLQFCQFSTQSGRPEGVEGEPWGKKGEAEKGGRGFDSGLAFVCDSCRMIDINVLIFLMRISTV